MQRRTKRTRRGASWAAAVVAAGSVLALAVQVAAVGTPAGTAITNQATVDYQDSNGNNLQALSNVVTTIVTQQAAVQVAPDNAQSATPGDTLYYAHTVTNLGNGTDVFDVTATSSQGWTTLLYNDVDGNGLFTGGTDTPLADTNGSGTADTDSIAADDSLRILVCVVVPAAATDGTIDVTTVTATSAFDNGQSENATDTTTISSPTIAVVKAVAPAGPQPPGTQLTYTITVTNNGSGAATNVVLTDPIPTNTTYVSNSILQDSAPRTDAGGDDNADYNVTNAGQITVSIGALAASGGSTTIEFRVTIN